MRNYIILVSSIFMILFLCGNVTAAQIPDNNDINLTVSNDNGARFNDNNDNTYSFFKGTGTGGTNALKINDDNGTTAKVISTSAQSGTFYIVNTGGKGYSDNAILMLALNGTIPDDFQLHITASGYQWAPLLTGKPLYDDVTYNSVTLDETFTKSDFIYGPQIWKPYYQSDYPIYEKQDMSNISNTFYIMFIDLYSGILKQSDYSQSLMNSGAVKIQYSFQNLPAGSLAAFNAYTYALAPETGQTTGGIAWTNKVNTASQTAVDSTGYYVNGVNSNAPTADFTATPKSGTSPLNVQFNDQSTGNPSSYAWDFDNNGITDSTAQNPTYIYSSPGTYTVKLTVTGPGGSNSITKTNYITVNNVAPVAAFTATLTTGTAPLSVQFTDQSTGSPTSYAWDFNNDGTVDSTSQNPGYTYNAAGTYTVKLTVTNPKGSDDEIKTDYITVNYAPVANFVANTTSGTAPQSVHFTDQSTGLVTGWSWDFNNDGMVDSTQQNPDYTYSNSGTYAVKLTVTGPGGSNEITKFNYITVNAADTTAPTASVSIKGGLYNANKVVTLRMSELGTIYYTLNGGTPTKSSAKYTGPITITSSTTLRFFAVDLAGNPSSVYSEKYTIDKVAPRVISTYPKNGAKWILRKTTMIIRFSENIRSSINWSKIVVRNKYGRVVSIIKWISGNTLYIKTIYKRLRYSYYTVYIPPGAIKDAAGNNGLGIYFRFKTGRY